MRFQRLCLVILFGSLPTSNAAQVSLLEDKKHEWAFTYSLTDTKDIGTFTSLGFQWQWASSSGRHQVGALSSYADVSFDDPLLGTDTTILLLGPVYTFNWTPSNHRGTGFIEVSGGEVGGDAQDSFEAYGQFAIGGKIFIGNSAAVTIRYLGTNLKGVDFVDDLESASLTAGISFFTGLRGVVRHAAEAPVAVGQPPATETVPVPSVRGGNPSIPPTISTPLAQLTGVLSIDANVPNAEVLIDGRLIGTTPLKQLPLSVGTHAVQVSKRGFTPWRQEMMVLRDASASLVVELEAIPAEQ